MFKKTPQILTKDLEEKFQRYLKARDLEQRLEAQDRRLTLLPTPAAAKPPSPSPPAPTQAANRRRTTIAPKVTQRPSELQLQRGGKPVGLASDAPSNAEEPQQKDKPNDQSELGKATNTHAMVDYILSVAVLDEVEKVRWLKFAQDNAGEHSKLVVMDFLGEIAKI